MANGVLGIMGVFPFLGHSDVIFAIFGIGHIISIVEGVVKDISAVLQWADVLFTNTPLFISDVFNLLFAWLFGCSVTGMTSPGTGHGVQVVMGSCKVFGYFNGVPNVLKGEFFNFYSITTGAGVMIAAVAATTRMFKALLDVRTSTMNMVTDVVMRFAAAVLIIQVAGDMMWAAVVASQNVGGAFEGAFYASAASSTGIGAILENLAGLIVPLVILGLAGGPLGLVVIVIVGIVVALFLYDLFLLFVRNIMLGFCFAMAPLCIATAAYDFNNRFFRYWWDMLIGALMIPIVMGMALSVTAGMAFTVFNQAHGSPVMLMLCLMVVMGGTWMAGKMVHGLTWSKFQHGGVKGALEAGIAATVVAPKAMMAADSMTGGGLSKMMPKTMQIAQEMSTGMKMGAMGGGGGRGGGGGGGGTDTAQMMGAASLLAQDPGYVAAHGGGQGGQGDQALAALNHMFSENPGAWRQHMDQGPGAYWGGAPAASRGTGPSAGTPPPPSAPQGNNGSPPSAPPSGGTGGPSAPYYQPEPTPPPPDEPTPTPNYESPSSPTVPAGGAPTFGGTTYGGQTYGGNSPSSPTGQGP